MFLKFHKLQVIWRQFFINYFKLLPFESAFLKENNKIIYIEQSIYFYRETYFINQTPEKFYPYSVLNIDITPSQKDLVFH